MYRLCLFVMLAFCASAALAADDSRKVNFQIVIVDHDNEAMTECADDPPPKPGEACKVKRPVTLGLIAMRALVAPEQNLPPEEGLKRGQLAMSVYKSPGALLTAEETALIKKQIGKFYGPLIVMRAFALLDPAAK